MDSCIFQFHNGKELVFTSDIMKLDDALLVWKKYLEEFKTACLVQIPKGLQAPDMVIWNDCAFEGDFHAIYKELNGMAVDIDKGQVYIPTTATVFINS